MLAELMRWVARRRRAFRVTGTSMEPELRDGELILIDPRGEGSVGDIVVCGHPFRPIDVVKRVAASDAGFLTLSSPSGTDSSQFGRVRIEEVRGRATASLSRFRRLSSPRDEHR